MTLRCKKRYQAVPVVDLINCNDIYMHTVHSGAFPRVPLLAGRSGRWHGRRLCSLIEETYPVCLPEHNYVGVP